MRPPCPPVPGQPFSKCLPPANTIALATTRTADGLSRLARPAAGNARADGGEHRQRGQNRDDEQGRHRDRRGYRGEGGGGGGARSAAARTTASRWSAGTTSRRRSRARPRDSSRARPGSRSRAVRRRCRRPCLLPWPPGSRSGRPHRPAADSRATRPPRTTSIVRPGACGRSSMSETSSSANSSPYRSRQVLGYQRSSRSRPPGGIAAAAGSPPPGPGPGALTRWSS